MYSLAWTSSDAGISKTILPRPSEPQPQERNLKEMNGIRKDNPSTAQPTRAYLPNFFLSARVAFLLFLYLDPHISPPDPLNKKTQNSLVL